ncbi:hypothetical protein QN277_020187 [Acacia crassicarpa]|uniref:Tyrosinase copper-binding domain-containing protein n=1 Tax=Acacia crassicarpa TaxID=499986 RepID=A0AAE1JNI8_9FABA|nr:hypothetical protein QN277_020187 [Acacia crassicarpa]
MASLSSSLFSNHRLFRNHDPTAIKSIEISNNASRVKCKATKDNNFDHSNPKNHHHQILPSLARRNLLLGLGGLYGALHHHNDPLSSIAAPIPPPDLTACGPPDLPSGAKPTNCCPPQLSSNIINFTPPLNPTLRTRPAAHLVDATYVDNYNEAIRRMKALPQDDPRNFTQQANIHCAYCDGSYHQVGFPDLELQVHNSWLFFPFHRWYLYFYERILASLIKDRDPNFALPFWNWDAPDGMPIPNMYSDPMSPLYDALRNANHQSPTPVNFNFNGVEDQTSSDEQVATNLNVMYRQMVSGSRTPSIFFGQPYRAGDDSAGGGSVENVPHGPVHVWTGDNTQPNFEDMGSLYSAGRDPIFYSHHSNIDRMWEIWKTLGGRRQDLTDPDWLESGFLFYDENKNLVNVKIMDCLDTRKLGYVYQDVNVPWLQAKPTPRRSRALKALKKTFGVAAAHASNGGGDVKFPVVLESSVRKVVKREKKGRSREEKEEEEEVLVIEGIEFESDVAVKFDVYVNDEEEEGGGGPRKTEFAGSFVSVPHKHRHNDKKGKKKKMKTSMRIGITELVEDLGADEEDYVLVTLVPYFGKGHVTIGGISIEHH